MITETKMCKQCGEVKPLTQYRRYYGGRKGTYTMCKHCESINSREKYLSAKAELTEAEAEELDKIHMLYDFQLRAGLKPPTWSRGRRSSMSEALDSELAKYSKMSEQVMTEANKLHSEAAQQVPAELVEWRTKPLDREPEYYLDEVYEALCRKYRPVLRIDKDTKLPVYDNTYKVVLDRILDRFNEYEDAYYAKEEN